MRALTFDGKVVQVEMKEFQVSPRMLWVDCPDDCMPGWAFENGAVVRPIIPPKTLDEIVQEFKSGLQDYIDRIAAERQYTSALYCASYTSSTNALWKAEADSFIGWRDAVWTYCYQELPKFMAGERPLISLDEFIKELPVIVWPV